MSLFKSFLTVFVGLVAVLVGFYQFSVRPKLVVLGEGRVVQPVGNTKCVTYPESKACESKFSIYSLSFTFERS